MHRVTPLKVLLGRGIANHPGLLGMVARADLGREVHVIVHHRDRPVSQDVRFEPERPTADTDAYVSECLRACEAAGAEVFWPGREVERVALRSAEFAASGVKVLSCASPDDLHRLEDKSDFSEACNKAGIAAPLSIPFDSLDGFDSAFDRIRAMDERVCFKPRRGIFGRGFRVVREDLDLFRELLEDPSYRIDLEDARRRFSSCTRFQPMVAMPWLAGVEWSVDCFRASNGDVFVGLARRKTSGQVQELDPDAEVVARSSRLAELFGLRGVFNCQFKYHRGEPFALEINARPAGGVGLTALTDVNLAELALRDLLDLPVAEPRRINGFRATLTQTWRHAGALRVEGRAVPEHTTLPVELQESEPPPASEPILTQLGDVRLVLTQTSGSWPASQLIKVALRLGARRPFLLVSKVLGKHLPATPATLARTHSALAASMPSNLPGPVLFVGMSETATGLGWGVHGAWVTRTGRADTLYLTTTRYVPGDAESLTFEEVHSHAPNQVICLPTDPHLARSLWQARTLVVVDDEMTSGKTMASLRAALGRVAPALSDAVAVALIDASPDHATVAGGPLSGWLITSLARLKLELELTGPEVQRTSLEQPTTRLPPGFGLQRWGRLGSRAAPELPAALVASVLAELQEVELVTCIGYGECMHPAFVLGRALEMAGLNVRVQATTRSPIANGDVIRSTLPCDDVLGSSAPFYLHNPPAPSRGNLVLHEPGLREAAERLAGQLGGSSLEVWDA